MSLLLDGVAEAGGAPVSGVGLDDEPLHTLVEGQLAAIVSNHAGADPEPAIDSLRDYESTLRRLMERGAFLPARFGSVLADEGAVRALLRRRHRDLLLRVRRGGAVELALRASWRAGAICCPAPDRSPARPISASASSCARARAEWPASSIR